MGVPSEPTLFRVESGIDNNKLADKMLELIEKFHIELMEIKGNMPETISVDGKAMCGTVQGNGRNCQLPISVAIVATGLGKTYPKENGDLELAILQKRGMIVSEYPEGTKTNPTRLIARTRLQMAIADKVIVVACEIDSGTMHAIDWAIKLGKPIFAINNTRSGNRHIIDSSIATPIALQTLL